MNSLMRLLPESGRKCRNRKTLQETTKKAIERAKNNGNAVYSLKLSLLHIKRPEGELDDLVSVGRERVEQTLNVVVVGVGKVWALKYSRRLAKSTGELDAIAS